jgi:hypothetical protein
MGNTINRGVVAAKQWGKGFWSDYAERVGSTFLYALITFLTVVLPEGDLSFGKLWPVLGLPVALAAIKGLLANMKNQGTGASLLPDPPGPVISDRGYTTVAFSMVIFGAALVAATIWPWLYTNLQ